MTGKMPSPDKGPAEPSPNTFTIIIFVIRVFVKYRLVEVGGTGNAETAFPEK